MKKIAAFCDSPSIQCTGACRKLLKNKNGDHRIFMKTAKLFKNKKR